MLRLSRALSLALLISLPVVTMEKEKKPKEKLVLISNSSQRNPNDPWNRKKKDRNSTNEVQALLLTNEDLAPSDKYQPIKSELVAPKELKWEGAVIETMQGTKTVWTPYETEQTSPASTQESRPHPLTQTICLMNDYTQTTTDILEIIKQMNQVTPEFKQTLEKMNEKNANREMIIAALLRRVNEKQAAQEGAKGCKFVLDSQIAKLQQEANEQEAMALEHNKSIEAIQALITTAQATQPQPAAQIVSTNSTPAGKSGWSIWPFSSNK